MARRRKMVQRRNARWIIGGIVAAIVVLGVVIAASLTFSTTKAVPAAATGSAAAKGGLACGGQTCGAATAPVTIDVYADFQCPYCAHADQVLQQLAPTYIDTGKVKLTYHNFAFLGAESEWAAQAAKCAADQNQFWTFGNYLFTHQAGENTGAFSRDALKKTAAQLKLDTSAFNACLDGGQYVSAVKQETAEGQQRGVKATPTFFIDGKKYEGALSLEQLTALIDARLK